MAYGGCKPLTPGTPLSPGVGFQIVCTVAGNVAMKMADGTVNIIPVATGLTVLNDYAVQDVVAGSTTATATYGILTGV